MPSKIKKSFKLPFKRINLSKDVQNRLIEFQARRNVRNGKGSGGNLIGRFLSGSSYVRT